MAAHREWTTKEVAILLQGIDDGLSCRAIARALGTRTDDALSAKIAKMGIQRVKSLRAGPGKGEPRSVHEISRLRTLVGDLRFKQAMLAAIHSGAETVIPMVVRDVSPRYTPHIHAPSSLARGGSPAGQCADLAMPD